MMRNKLYVVMVKDSEWHESPVEYFLSKKQADIFCDWMKASHGHIYTYYVEPHKLYIKADDAMADRRK